MAAEANLERGLALYASKKGWYCRKWVCPARRGVPDRIFINPTGKVFFIEFKSKSGRLSKLQEREIRMLENANANVLIINDLDEGKTFVDVNTKTE